MQKNAAAGGPGSMDGSMAMQAGSQVSQGLLTDVKDPKLVNELVSYALSSVQEMQQRGVAPHLIQLVERHRDTLKSMLEQQRAFQRNIQTAAQQGGVVPQGQQRNLSNTMMNGQPAGMNLQNGMRATPAGPQPGMSTPANGQPPQQMGANGAQGHSPSARPTAQQLHSAMEMVRRLREENKSTCSNVVRPILADFV